MFKFFFIDGQFYFLSCLWIVLAVYRFPVLSSSPRFYNSSRTFLRLLSFRILFWGPNFLHTLYTASSLKLSNFMRLNTKNWSNIHPSPGCTCFVISSFPFRSKKFGSRFVSIILMRTFIIGLYSFNFMFMLCLWILKSAGPGRNSYSQTRSVVWFPLLFSRLYSIFDAYAQSNWHNF